jgi:hypothetical protein
MATNNIVNSRGVSTYESRIDVFNANNVVVAEYKHGRRIYCEPCPHRLDYLVNGEYRGINKLLSRIEGW